MKRAALILSISIAIPLHWQPKQAPLPATGYQLPGGTTTSPLAIAAAAKSSEGRAFVTRAGVGVVGWFAGAAAGLFTALALPHHDCQCDDPGLEEAVTGLVIGSTIGAAAGASLPSLGRGCKYRTRLGRALLGSVAGTLIGALIAIPTNQDFGWIAVPAASASGAALAIGRC